jgi:[1-hydroxy-2-(trimethylamino)ethyl]phosphonate dioxygenase
MDAEECADFENNPAYHDALRLRRWDDTAKVPGLKVPALKHYRERIEHAQITSPLPDRSM